MPKFEEMLCPANLIQLGNVILAGSGDHRSRFTVMEIKRLVLCFEITCEPYRRYVVQPHDGLWIVWNNRVRVAAG